MPATYAHYRMGQEVLRQLSGSIREAIEQYPDLYNIGLHGPDLLFYYNAFGRNHINSIGVQLHKYPGSFFFKRTGELIQRKRMDPAYLSHAYGFLCHFALDVSCHEPDSLEDYSGQFKLRIPRSLHRSLAEHSKREGISMNQYCVYLLSRNDAVYSK